MLKTITRGVAYPIDKNRQGQSCAKGSDSAKYTDKKAGEEVVKHQVTVKINKAGGKRQGLREASHVRMEIKSCFIDLQLNL